MTQITAGEAAKILGISKRTLYRWEDEGKIQSIREGLLKIRVYDRDYIEIAKKVIDLGKEEKAHLKKLPDVKKQADEYGLLQEYVPGRPLKLSTNEEVAAAMKAFDAEEAWLEKHKRILFELFKYPKDLIRKLTMEE